MCISNESDRTSESQQTHLTQYLFGSTLKTVTVTPLLLGIGALFGFHLCYFLALENAPAAEANLLDATWPVLIVIFSSLLPSHMRSHPLRLVHLLGAALAFLGAGLTIGLHGDTFSIDYIFGYGMAFTAAIIWSSYSVLTRLFQNAPTSAVSLYCLGTALLAWLVHLATETFVMPPTLIALISLIALGLGPVGLAFYVWDYGCKYGNLRLLGVMAYFAPILSTSLLIILKLTPPKPDLLSGAALITLGALIAGYDIIFEMLAQSRLSRHYRETIRTKAS